MAKPRTDELGKILKGLLSERRAIAEKEKQFIGALNRVLGQMGYRVTPARGAAPAEAAPPRRRRGRRPGRPRGRGPGRPAKRLRRQGSGQPGGTGVRPRRGRPPKIQEGT